MRLSTGIRATALAILSGVAVALAGTAAGCRAAPPKRALGPVEAAFVPAFEALGRAVDAGDDEVAQRVLAGILARAPAGDTLARAEGYGRILTGRRLARALQLALVVAPLGDRGGVDGDLVRVRLEARHDLDRALRVRSLPGILELLITGVDPGGLEQRSARSVGVPAVADFEVPAGSAVHVRLGDFAVPVGTALAVRASFELSFPSGELFLDGEPYPANDLTVQPCSIVRLAGFLPSGPVEPSELVRYLKGERVSTPALLERAVRIPPERRVEALDLLCAEAELMTYGELERGLPALRWLSGNRHLGADAESWRQWLRARSEPSPEASSGADEDPAAALELPAGPAALPATVR